MIKATITTDFDGKPDLHISYDGVTGSLEQITFERLLTGIHDKGLKFDPRISTSKDGKETVYACHLQIKQ